MKLLCKKIKSHTYLEVFQSTNNTNRRGHSVLFQSFSRDRKPKNTEEERWKLIKNGAPKSTIPLKTYSVETIFWNGRMVGKQKSSTRALRIHNWQVLSAHLDTAMANITDVSLTFWLIKLMKEQSLFFCNSKYLFPRIL